MFMETPPEVFYNLPLILAYCSLDEVLTTLSGQGLFPLPKGAMLGTKMQRAKNVLPWIDYKAVVNGKRARNDLAHKAVLLSKTKCLRFVGVVERELRAWAVL